MESPSPSSQTEIPSSVTTLYFDNRCVVCRSFAKLLLNRLVNKDFRIEPIESLGRSLTKPQIPAHETENKNLENHLDFNQVDNFLLHLSDGKSVSGKEAIDVLAKRYPEVKDFFWMLPDSARLPALKKMYWLGKWLRRLLKQDCNC